MHYVYVLQSLKKNWIYIGCTDDLKTKLFYHRGGKVSSTKPHRPFILVYYEAYKSKTDARVREYKLKHHNQTREILYKQLTKSIAMAPSSRLV